MTQLSDKEHNVQMEDMVSFDEQMPCVGIFWYDPEDNTLFGVRKKELTPQMVEEAAVKGKPFINYLQGGRVAWTIDKFIVLVGKWAEPIQDKLSELLEQEFLAFAKRIAKCYRFLKDKKDETVMSKQLLQCLTGLGRGIIQRV